MSKKYNTPLWVKWAILGIKTRKSAMLVFLISLASALVAGTIGMLIEDYSLWTLLFVPLWYWIVIKWIDVFASWPFSREND